MSRNENNAKSGGLSLVPGTAAYQRYLLAALGFDLSNPSDKEAALEILRDSVAPGFMFLDTKSCDAYSEQIRQFAQAESMCDEVSRNASKSTGQQVVRQIRKSIVAEDAMRTAKSMAADSESKKEQKFIRHKLPNKLEDMVYDNGKNAEDIEEFYPGSRRMSKYM